jgi:tetratricopeptide (TPR) repeat protein
MILWQRCYVGLVPNIDLDKTNKSIKAKKRAQVLLYPLLAILAVIAANYLFDYITIKKKFFANPITRMQFYYKEKNYLKAIEIGEDIIEKNQDSLLVRRYLWKSYLYTNQFGMAAKQLEKIGQYNTDNTIEVNFGYCNLYRYMEQYEKAKYFCEKVLESDPAYEQAHDLIIQILLEQKNYTEATKYLESVYSNSSDKLKKYILQAAVASSQNDFKKSISILEEAKKSNPYAPIIYYTLGMNYFETGEYTKSVGYLEEFTEQVSSDEIAAEQLDSAFETLGASYEKSNMFLNASRTYKKAACFGMKKGETDFAVRMVKKVVNTTYVGYAGFVSAQEFDKRFNSVVKDLEGKCSTKLFSQGGEN